LNKIIGYEQFVGKFILMTTEGEYHFNHGLDSITTHTFSDFAKWINAHDRHKIEDVYISDRNFRVQVSGGGFYQIFQESRLTVAVEV
jgi:hypothetical protein